MTHFKNKKSALSDRIDEFKEKRFDEKKIKYKGLFVKNVFLFEINFINQNHLLVRLE